MSWFNRFTAYLFIGLGIGLLVDYTITIERFRYVFVVALLVAILLFVNYSSQPEPIIKGGK